MIVYDLPSLDDNCSATLNFVSGIASGTVMSKDDPTSTVVYEAIDAAGLTSTCSFTVTVYEFDNPVLSMACNDQVNVSLDDNGEAVITADMILEGGPYGCYDDYEVSVDGTNNLMDCSDVDATYTVQERDIFHSRGR